MIPYKDFKPSKDDKKGKQVLVIGKKGSGKTYFTKKLLDKYPNHVVFDVNNEYKGYKRYIPSNYDGQSQQVELELLLKKIILPNAGKVDLLVVEEADMTLPNKGELTPMQRALINLNRHLGLTVVYITRRPQLINTNVPALADFICCFKLDDVNDLKRIGELHPAILPNMEKVTSENHNFVMYDGSNATIEKA